MIHTSVVILFVIAGLVLLIVIVRLMRRASQRDTLPAAPLDADRRVYRPGQVWRYNTRPGEEASTATVLRVDEHPVLGEIVHLAVDGLRLSATNEHAVNDVRHMPFAAQALASSLTTVLMTAESLPEFEDGYAMWREAFDRGTAGVFTISIADALSGMEDAMRKA